MYQAYIRRFRPRSFSEVVGQDGITATLMKALETDRVANAYLFAGLRGVGKTSTARILAKSLNCTKGPTPQPCNQCDACQATQRGEDIDVIEIDAASNTSVDDMRALRDSAIYAPARSRYKVYIIDEAHMLSAAAFNALLKTLEEPPAHVKFIFATTEPNRIPETVRSRMQRFDFRPIGISNIARRLRQIADEEKIQVNDEVILAIARRARGGLRDAESLLDQLATLAYGREISEADVLSLTGTVAEERLAALLAAALDGQAAEVVRQLEALYAEGSNPADLLEQLHALVRGVMLRLAGAGDEQATLGIPAGAAAPLAERLDLAGAVSMLGMLGHYRFEMRYAPDAQAVLEVALLRIASGEALRDISELLGVAGAPASSKTPAAALAEAPATANVAPAWWQEALAGVADKRLAASLATGAPSEPDAAGALTLTFSKVYHYDQVKAGEQRVRGAIENALGRAVRLRLVLAKSADAAGPAGDLFSEPLVKRLVKELDGQVEAIE